jgi:hypothetical protein
MAGQSQNRPPNAGDDAATASIAKWLVQRGVLTK